MLRHFSIYTLISQKNRRRITFRTFFLFRAPKRQLIFKLLIKTVPFFFNMYKI